MTVATARVPMATVAWGDDKVERTTQFATTTIYYPGEMICLTTPGGVLGGVVDHASDTAGLTFDGICSESDRIFVFSTDTAGRPMKVERPWRFAMAIAGAAAGDEGKRVYVVDNQTVGYSTQNAVFVGCVDQVLSATSVLIRPWWAGSDPVQEQTIPNPLANFRNLIDGGDFTTNPWQRGTSQGSDITSTVTYGPDRFFLVGGGSSALDWSQVADTTLAGFNQCLKMQRKSGNSDTHALNLGQVLESADCIKAQGQKVTLSFYGKAGANYSGGALTVALNHSTTAGNDADAHLVAASTNWQATPTIINSTQALTSSWVRYSFTGTVPAAATQLGVLLTWTPTGTAGSDDSVSFQGFQLEIGSEATPFEHRDIEVELALCQRYFVQINEVNGATFAIGVPTGANAQTYAIWLPTPMRTAPTVNVTVGGFKTNTDGGGNATPTGLAAGTAHSPTIITLVTTLTQTAAAHTNALVGTGTTGNINASADF
jgi:hypothetical protein